MCSYKLQHGKGRKFKIVKREAQSLVLLMTQDEQNNDENLTRDSLDFPDVSSENDEVANSARKAKKVKVKIAKPSSSIVDIT